MVQPGLLRLRRLDRLLRQATARRDVPSRVLVPGLHGEVLRRPSGVRRRRPGGGRRWWDDHRGRDAGRDSGLGRGSHARLQRQHRGGHRRRRPRCIDWRAGRDRHERSGRGVQPGADHRGPGAQARRPLHGPRLDLPRAVRRRRHAAGRRHPLRRGTRVLPGARQSEALHRDGLDPGHAAGCRRKAHLRGLGQRPAQDRFCHHRGGEDRRRRALPRGPLAGSRNDHVHPRLRLLRRRVLPRVLAERDELRHRHADRAERGNRADDR